MRCLAPRSTLRQAPRKACEPPRCGQPAQGLCSEAQQDHPFSCLRFPGNQGGQRLEPAMDVYFYTRLRKPAPLCRFGSAQSVELHSLNGTLHVFRQLFHQPFDVVCTLGVDIVVVCHDLIGLFDRHVSERGAVATQEIDQFITRDRMYPRRQGLDGIIGMSLEGNRQYRLLTQILRLCYATPNSREFALVIGTQTAAQSVEQRAVRSRVAVLAGKHQCLEFDFVGRHACVSLFSSLARPVLLQLTVQKNSWNSRSQSLPVWWRASTHSAACERSNAFVEARFEVS